MLFLGQSVEKTQATGCFHRFLLFAYKRNAVFPIFCISLASESQFSVFFVRRLQAKRCFSRFLHFACERRASFYCFLPFLLTLVLDEGKDEECVVLAGVAPVHSRWPRTDAAGNSSVLRTRPIPPNSGNCVAPHLAKSDSS